ncbi:hypothetical protein LCGC14_3098980, partial [marine sediment metagenome]
MLARGDGVENIMAERLSDRLREYLRATQGRVVNLKDIRAELKI